MRKITAHELKRRMDAGERMQIIDIRDHVDYDVCHIPGAVSLPKKVIFDHLNQIAKEMPVVVYCRYGTKTPPVIIALENDHGVRNLLSLEDGIYAWAKDIDSWMLDLI
jgi:rhodanese-related sulfurtransferase